MLRKTVFLVKHLIMKNVFERTKQNDLEKKPYIKNGSKKKIRSGAFPWQLNYNCFREKLKEKEKKEVVG